MGFLCFKALKLRVRTSGDAAVGGNSDFFLIIFCVFRFCNFCYLLQVDLSFPYLYITLLMRYFKWFWQYFRK